MKGITLSVKEYTDIVYGYNLYFNVMKGKYKDNANKSAGIIRYISVKTAPSVKVLDTLLAVHLMIYSSGLHKTQRSALRLWQ